MALAARAGWSYWAQPLPPYFSDAEYYDAAARSLASGEGYSVLLTPEGFEPGGSATAFFPPGYSLYLSAAYRLLGSTVASGRAANVLAGALTAPLAYLIGRRLFSPSHGLLAAAGAAVLPSLVFWTPVLLSETFFTFVFAAAVLLVLRTLGKDGRLSIRSAALAGFVVGLGALVRGQALVLLPVAVLWWRLSGAETRSSLRAGLVALVAAFVVLLPWAIRNASVFDSPVLLSTNLGYNLRVGHAPYATGRFIDPQDLDLPASDYQHLELLANEEGARRALDYAWDNPRRELELAIAKVRWLWSPDPDVLLWIGSFGRTPLSAGTESLLRLLVVISYWLLMALVGFAIVTRSAERKSLVFAGLLSLAWTAVHVVFFGEPRYHLPLLPVLLPFAAAGLLAIVRFAPLPGPALPPGRP